MGGYYCLEKPDIYYGFKLMGGEGELLHLRTQFKCRRALSTIATPA